MVAFFCTQFLSLRRCFIQSSIELKFEDVFFEEGT
jgi:hypothetical protein